MRHFYQLMLTQMSEAIGLQLRQVETRQRRGVTLPIARTAERTRPDRAIDRLASVQRIVRFCRRGEGEQEE